MQDVDFGKHSDSGDFIGMALCTLIGQQHKEIIPPPNLDKPAFPVFKVEVKINGVEVNFTDLCDGLLKSWQSSVNKRAEEILKDKLANITNMVYRLESHVEMVVRETVR